MKIFGIEGEKIWTDGEDKHTQDWTFNNYPILELRNPQVTYEIADSLERNWNDLPTFAEEQKKRVDADVATYGGGLPNQHSKSRGIEGALCSLRDRWAVIVLTACVDLLVVVAMPEYSQSAYRYGDYVAKFGVFPNNEEQKKLADCTMIADIQKLYHAVDSWLILFIGWPFLHP